MTAEEVYRIAYQAAEHCLIDNDIRRIKNSLSCAPTDSEKRWLESQLLHLECVREDTSNIR
jgi:hypothetical protein